MAYGALPAKSHAAQEAEPARELGKISVEAGEEVSEFKADEASSRKYTAPLLDTPKSVTVITQEVLRSTGSTSLVEALRTTPGITLGAGEGGNPVGDRPFLRGFDTQSSTFIDGMRDIGAQSREVFNLESVEVSKGPGGAYDGRGAAGGSLNLVTKAPRARSFLAGTVGGGTDNYRRATLDGNVAFGEAAGLRLNAMYHDADVPGRNEVFNKRWGVAPSLGFGMGTDTTVTLGYYHLQSDNFPDTGIPYDNPLFRARADAPPRVLQTGNGDAIDVNRNTFYGLVDRDFYKDKADIATARVEHRFSDTLSLRNTARYSETGQDYIWTQPDDSKGIIYYGQLWRRVYTRVSQVQTIANQTELAGRIESGALKHSFAGGIELSREQGENDAYTVATGSDNLPALAADPAGPAASRWCAGRLQPHRLLQPGRDSGGRDRLQR
jgi:catecholate siderophore receptor